MGVTMRVDYDPARDVLIGVPRPAPRTVAEPAAEDLFWLRDEDTGDVVGFECLWFSRNVRSRAWIQGLPLEPTFYREGRPEEPLPLGSVLLETWRVAQDRMMRRGDPLAERRTERVGELVRA